MRQPVRRVGRTPIRTFVKPRMTSEITAKRPTAPAAIPAALAALIALLGWVALAIEFDRSVSLSLSKGRGWGEALFLYFRFFTILTNIGVATLMSVTAMRLAAGRSAPPTRVFNAGLIYILVTSVTYEWLLRSQWHPRGLQFYTDIVIHDVVPALTLLFWLAFAPRDNARWRDALWMLAYPAAFFAATLLAGALGQDYPYDFLDVDKLGYARVFVTGVIFVAVFYVLGLATTALSRSWAGTQR